jgi:hypothetical protein
MGNTISQKPTQLDIELSNSCISYKHNDIVNVIYDILGTKYGQIEAMCDIASWLLRYLLIKHRNYNEEDVVLVCGFVQEIDHVWVYDKKENVYIDITIEQFNESTSMPCFYIKQKSMLLSFGYTITDENCTTKINHEINKLPEILYDSKKRAITKEQLITMIEQRLFKRGGKKRKTKRRKST